ncbi:MAG: MBL fold metallo-hydrolase [Patescibacteria group bacterium]|nr:MBL fold metallo-hydrolase [Patescibacteria group bacterium]
MSTLSKKYLSLIIILLFLINALIAVAFWRDNSVEGKKPRVIFFDVGQGDAAMIDLEGDTQILIDGGDGKDILNKLGKYLPFYDKKIELMIMTHPDKDHIGGLVEVLRYYEVEQILMPGIKCEKAICQERDKLIAEKDIPVKYAEFGQGIKAGNINMTVLHPFESLKDKEVKDSNDASIIFKFTLNDSSYLLTGDAGFKVDKKLLDKNINLEAEILKVSHHGSKYGTSNEFLQTVKPEKAIISVGKNSYGHPAGELLNRLKNINARIFRTDKIGDVIFYNVFHCSKF